MLLWPAKHGGIYLCKFLLGVKEDGVIDNSCGMSQGHEDRLLSPKGKQGDGQNLSSWSFANPCP